MGSYAWTWAMSMTELLSKLEIENVLDERCRVKLSDFGFTREFEKSTLLDTLCGTIGYASPEMLLARKYLGEGG